MSMKVEQVPATVEETVEERTKRYEQMVRRILTTELLLLQLGQTEDFLNDLRVERARLKKLVPAEFFRDYVRWLRDPENPNGIRSSEKGILYY